MHISFTELSRYWDCPKKFALINEHGELRDSRRAFIGNLLGKLVERLYKEGHARLDPLRVVEWFHDQIPVESTRLTVNHRLPWGPGEQAKWEQVARETVPKIIATIREESLVGDLYRVEHEMALDVRTQKGGQHTLHGRADLMIVDSAGAVTLVDGKGGSTVGKYTTQDQLRYYAILQAKTTGKLPARAGFWWFRHQVVKWMKPPSRDLMIRFFDDKILKTLDAISAGAFEPTPSPSTCSLCDGLSRCVEGQAFLVQHECKVPLDGTGGTVSLG